MGKTTGATGYDAPRQSRRTSPARGAGRVRATWTHEPERAEAYGELGYGRSRTTAASRVAGPRRVPRVAETVVGVSIKHYGDFGVGTSRVRAARVFAQTSRRPLTTATASQPGVKLVEEGRVPVCGRQRARFIRVQMHGARVVDYVLVGARPAATAFGGGAYVLVGAWPAATAFGGGASCCAYACWSTA